MKKEQGGSLYLEDLSFTGLTGRVVTPADPIFNEARQEYNRAIQKFPLAIVYCRNKQDVSNAVLWACRNNVPLRIRSGGHNYAGYSTGNNVLVIDLSEMNHIDIDEAAGTVTVQGGVTNRQLYDFLGARGYPFPGGTCPTVGVCGYTLGGGWGLSCRKFGLGCDSLKSADMINDEGAVVRAERKHNEDLFWALRGAGGGNFGVIVSMTFYLPPKTDNVTYIEISYPKADREKQEGFLAAWQKWLKAAPDTVTLQARIFNSAAEGLGVFSRGIFYGPPEGARDAVKALTGLGGAETVFAYMPFIEATERIEESYAPYELFKSASRFALGELTPPAISRVVGLVQSRPRGSVYLGLSLYALGGRVAEVPRDDSAFFYRRALYIMNLSTEFENLADKKDNAAFIAKTFPVLAAVTAGSYVNFPYAGLQDYLDEYYGLHVGRLLRVKEKYDPGNVFAFPQSIPG